MINSYLNSGVPTISDLKTRSEADGGVFELNQGVNKIAEQLNDGTFSSAGLMIFPNAVKTLKVYGTIPNSTNSDMVWTRASTATRINESGVLESSATGVPRIDYTDGTACLLVEPTRTNLYLNSATIVTQNVTTAADDYTVSFYGTGTITFTGTYSGSLVGTGASDRVELTFTATAGTLISTISGTVTDGQCELGAYSTSVIITSGATATRATDTGTGCGTSAEFNSEAGVLFAEISGLTDDSTYRRIAISDGTESNTVYIGYDGSATGKVQAQYRVAGTATGNVSKTGLTITDYIKLAIRYAVNDFSLWVDGVEVATDVSGAVLGAGVLTTLSLDKGAGTNPFKGKIRQIQALEYLTDTEMINLTT